MPVVITDLEHRAGDYPLDPEMLRALWAMEDRHFWHVARTGWILRALRASGVTPPAAVLEVGCGSGAVVRSLVGAGYRVTGVDTAEALVRKAHTRCPDAVLVVGRVARLPIGGRPFHAIGLFDVLEHLDDPLALLRDALAYARPGAPVLATVPAQQRLFSAIDEASGHKRRYERGELARLFVEAGLTEVEERGIFRLTVPIVRRVRKGATGSDAMALLRESVKVPPRPVNAGLRLLCRLERSLGWSRSVGRTGASLLAVGRVPGAS